MPGRTDSGCRTSAHALPAACRLGAAVAHNGVAPVCTGTRSQTEGGSRAGDCGDVAHASRGGASRDCACRDAGSDNQSRLPEPGRRWPGS